MKDYVSLALKRLIGEILSLGSSVRRGRFVWSLGHVAASDPPTLTVRNYLESGLLRSVLSGLGPFGRALDFGCGYGRLSIILQQFADAVYGVEREPQLVSIAKSLLPSIRFVRLE